MRELKQRWLPSIPQSLAVFTLWLLLMDGVTTLNVLTALLLGLLLPRIAARFDRELARMGSLRSVPMLIVHLLTDIVRANYTVAKQILAPSSRLQSAFIWVPLDITNIHAISALASIITLTPGTVSAVLSKDRRYLLVHCLDVRDPEVVARDIKQRYEQPLKEIYP